MATTKVGIAPMKVAQIPKAGAQIFRSLSARFQLPMQERCASGSRPVASATAMCSRRNMARNSSIPAFQDTKSWASLMEWVIVFPSGQWDSAPASAARRARWHVHLVQARRFWQLPKHENTWHQLRWRIPTIHGDSCGH